MFAVVLVSFYKLSDLDAVKPNNSRSANRKLRKIGTLLAAETLHRMVKKIIANVHRLLKFITPNHSGQNPCFKET